MEKKDMKEKKIIFFGANLYGTGGVEYVLSEVANYLSGYFDVIILSNNEKEISKTSVSPRVEVITFNPNTMYKKSRSIASIIRSKMLSVLRKTKLAYSNNRILQLFCIKILYTTGMRARLVNIVEKHKPDYIIGVGRGAVVLGFFSDKILCKTIGWHHSLFETTMNYDRTNIWPDLSKYIPKYLSRLSKNLVLTRHDKLKYEELGITSEVMPNFIDFSHVYESSLCNSSMIAVGRLAKEKRFDLLISIWKKFIDNQQGWTLNIFGEGDQRQTLEQLIDGLDLKGSVFLRGYSDKIELEYAQNSILLSTSVTEGFPLNVLEGLAAGLPVIAFDLPSLQDIVLDGETGYLVEENSMDNYLTCMKQLANDIKLRKKMSDTCKMVAQKYSKDTIMKKWMDILNN